MGTENKDSESDELFNEISVALRGNKLELSHIKKCLNQYSSDARFLRNVQINTTAFKKINVDQLSTYLSLAITSHYADKAEIIVSLGKLAAFGLLTGKLPYENESELFILIEQYSNSQTYSKEKTIDLLRSLAALTKNNHLNGQNVFTEQHQLYYLIMSVLRDAHVCNEDISQALFTLNHMLSYDLLSLPNNVEHIQELLIDLVSKIKLPADTKKTIRVKNLMTDICNLFYNIVRIDFILREKSVGLFESEVIREKILFILNQLKTHPEDKNKFTYMNKINISLDKISKDEEIQLTQGLFYIAHYMKGLSEKNLEICRTFIEETYTHIKGRHYTRSSKTHLEIAGALTAGIQNAAIKNENYFKCGFHGDILLKVKNHESIFIEIDYREFHQPKRDKFKDEMIRASDPNIRLVRIDISDWYANDKSSDWLYDQVSPFLVRKKSSITTSKQQRTPEIIPTQPNSIFAALAEDISNEIPDNIGSTTSKGRHKRKSRKKTGNRLKMKEPANSREYLIPDVKKETDENENGKSGSSYSCSIT